MARTMLHNKDVARNLWGEAVNTTCHTVNKVYFRPGTKKTPYELWKGRKPNMMYFGIFGSTCFILQPLHLPHLDFGLNLAFSFWYASLFSFSSCIFRPRFWVFLKFLWFSKIFEYFVKFLGWFLLI